MGKFAGKARRHRSSRAFAGAGTANISAPGAERSTPASVPRRSSCRGKANVYPSVADSGNQMHRRFCPTCGTPLFSEAEARPHLVFVRVGTFDHPNLADPCDDDLDVVCAALGLHRCRVAGSGKATTAGGMMSDALSLVQAGDEYDGGFVMQPLRSALAVLALLVSTVVQAQGSAVAEQASPLDHSVSAGRHH